MNASYCFSQRLPNGKGHFLSLQSQLQKTKVSSEPSSCQRCHGICYCLHLCSTLTHFCCHFLICGPLKIFSSSDTVHANNSSMMAASLATSSELSSFCFNICFGVRLWSKRMTRSSCRSYGYNFELLSKKVSITLILP